MARARVRTGAAAVPAAVLTPVGEAKTAYWGTG